jgi:hypothetical protein
VIANRKELKIYSTQKSTHSLLSLTPCLGHTELPLTQLLDDSTPRHVSLVFSTDHKVKGKIFSF